MKIIYKIFIFVLILRLVPVIITSMGIFPNVTFNDLGYAFNENSSAYDIMLNIVSPNPIYIFRDVPIVNIIPIIKDISIQMGLYIIISILIAVAFFRSGSVPTVVAGISALLFIPFLVDTGYVFLRGAESYHSMALTLTIVTIIVGIIAIGIITLLEGAAQSQDASDT